VRELGAALSAWLAAQTQLEADGPLRVMGYNSPMVPARKRFFEVELPVRWKKAAAD
jgi:hypothetical protein